jgi:hypothetical protein
VQAGKLAEAVVQTVTFLVVYPRTALGHAPSGAPPPSSAADAATLLETCNMAPLARFIQGVDDGEDAAATRREASEIVQRFAESLQSRMSLSARPARTAERLRAASAAVAPTFADVWARVDDTSVTEGAFDARRWSSAATVKLKEELRNMIAPLQKKCTAVEFGRTLASFVGKPEAGVGTLPPSAFVGAVADALTEPLTDLVHSGTTRGVELFSLMCKPLFDWAEFGSPILPPSLSLPVQDAPGAAMEGMAPLMELLFAAVNGVYDRADAEAERLSSSLKAATVTLLRTLLAAGRAALRADVLRALHRRIGSMNDTLWWRQPDVAAQAAALDAVSELLASVRRSKQAIQAPRSRVKSAKGTKLGRCEAAVPRVAAVAANAFVDCAHAALVKIYAGLLDDVGSLVSQHCARLAGLDSGGVAQLGVHKLWAALNAHAATESLGARIRQHVVPAGGAGDAAAGSEAPVLPPERLLEAPILARMVAELATVVPAGSATLAGAMQQGDDVLVMALKKAAKAEAKAAAKAAATARVSTASSASASAAQLLKQATKHDPEGRTRVAELVRFSLKQLSYAYGRDAPISAAAAAHDELSPRLLRFLEQAANAARSGTAAELTEELDAKWDVTRRYALLGCCMDAAAVLKSAAFPPVGDSLPQCTAQCLRWLKNATQKYNTLVQPLPQEDGAEAAAAGEEAAAPRRRARAAALVAAAAAAPPLPPADPPRTVEEVFTLLSALQASVGSGPEALRELRERYAPSPLKRADGWCVVAGALTACGARTTLYRYYGEVGADGRPTGLKPGDAAEAEALLDEPDRPPTREFTCWLQVHAFRTTGLSVALPRGADGGGGRRKRGGGRGGGGTLHHSEMEMVRCWMTPREVERDGVACPAERVATARGKNTLPGVWRLVFKTRQGGKSKGFQDVQYLPPDKVRRSVCCALAVRGKRLTFAPSCAECPERFSVAQGSEGLL